MKHISLSRHRKYFTVLVSSRLAQAAVMTLRKGQASSDEPENEHPGSEQWLYVIRGRARARVGRRTIAMKEGALLLIEKGERHQVTNPYKREVVTLNFYSPVAYTAAGELREQR